MLPGILYPIADAPDSVLGRRLYHSLASGRLQRLPPLARLCPPLLVPFIRLTVCVIEPAWRRVWMKFGSIAPLHYIIRVPVPHVTIKALDLSAQPFGVCWRLGVQNVMAGRAIKEERLVVHHPVLCCLIYNLLVGRICDLGTAYVSGVHERCVKPLRKDSKVIRVRGRRNVVPEEDESILVGHICSVRLGHLDLCLTSRCLYRVERQCRMSLNAGV